MAKIDVFTLFPEWFEWFSRASATSPTRSQRGSQLECVNFRDHTPLSGGQVDDTPFGGGAGMVLRVDVWKRRCARTTASTRSSCASRRRVIALAPGGRMLDDALVDELAAEPALTLLCGRYEGFDERILEHFAATCVSIGRYVLSGGELAAMVVCDAVAAQAAGRARSTSDSAVEESFSAALEGNPEYPHYTRPGRVPRLAGARRSCCPAITSGSSSGAGSAAASGAARARRATWRPAAVGSDAALAGRPLPFLAAPAGHPPEVPPGQQAPTSFTHEQRHRNHRARAAAPRSQLLAGRPREGALPGHRGHAPPRAGLRGRRDQAPGPRRARDLHRAQAVLRRRRRAHVPGALAEDRAHRAGRARRRAPRQALLPARPRRQARACARAPLHRPRRDRRAGPAARARGGDRRRRHDRRGDGARAGRRRSRLRRRRVDRRRRSRTRPGEPAAEERRREAAQPDGEATDAPRRWPQDAATRGSRGRRRGAGRR